MKNHIQGLSCMKYCTIHELARRSILSSLRERVLSSLSFWILIILLLSSGSIYAEQPKDTSGLLQQSLLHDISSFSGEMLETWVTSLGLAPARTDAENRNILESWYEIPIAADEKEIPHVDHVETFLIKQANSMQIMPKEETDSFIIILSGQVETSYKQQGVDDAAVVVADSITINSETGLVYATGNVA